MSVLITVLRQYRQRRDGFVGIGYDEELEHYFGSDISHASISCDDAVAVASTAYEALHDVRDAREWLSWVVSAPEESALVPLVVEVLDDMWDDPPAMTRTPLMTLYQAVELPAARTTLVRWSRRSDESGALARELLDLYERRRADDVEEAER